MSNNKYTEDMTGTGQHINYPNALIKHLCSHCKTVQYIPTKLRKLVSRMYCYVCGKKIEERESNMEILLLLVGYKLMEVMTKWDGMVCVSGCNYL